MDIGKILGAVCREWFAAMSLSFALRLLGEIRGFYSQLSSTVSVIALPQIVLIVRGTWCSVKISIPHSLKP
jgi:hypothetical protein